jgi:hypothetical protein
LGFYLKDTYDFVDEGNSSEPLGVWSKKPYTKQGRNWHLHVHLLIWFLGASVRSFSGFVPIFNKDFGSGKKHDSGGDYIVFSDVLWVSPRETDKEIPL